MRTNNKLSKEDKDWMARHGNEFKKLSYSCKNCESKEPVLSWYTYRCCTTSLHCCGCTRLLEESF